MIDFIEQPNGYVNVYFKSGRENDQGLLIGQMGPFGYHGNFVMYTNIRKNKFYLESKDLKVISDKLDYLNKEKLNDNL